MFTCKHGVAIVIGVYCVGVVLWLDAAEVM